MANYLTITGNKQKIISDFIEQQKKYWFVTQDRFTGIRTVHYNTKIDLNKQVEELVKYLQENKIDFQQRNDFVYLNTEWVDIYYEI